MEREVMGLAEFASHGRDPCNRLTPHSMPPRRAAIRRPQLLHRCTIAQARACARTLAARSATRASARFATKPWNV